MPQFAQTMPASNGIAHTAAGTSDAETHVPDQKYNLNDES